LKGKEIVGKPVISTEQGRVVGSVSDIYIDPASGRVRFLATTTGQGLFGRLGGQHHFVRRESLLGVGPDAITIGGAATLLPEQKVADEIESTRKLTSMLGRTVVSESGRKLGGIGDLSFSDDIDHVASIEVSKRVSSLGGLVQTDTEPKIIPFDKVTKVGPDLVVVNDGVTG
jgi:sporulation protein YlmC with PRC-barrel domain